MTLNGSPLVNRVRPAMLQPPMTASSQPGTSAPHFRPRPQGNSATQLKFIWCLMS